MRFRVTRTSTGEYGPCPCNGTKKEKYIRTQTFEMSEAQFDQGVKEHTWRSMGQNHRETTDGIVREFEDEAWSIEFTDLDKLMAFVAEHGDVVITPGEGEPPELEIYDNYRE